MTQDLFEDELHTPERSRVEVRDDVLWGFLSLTTLPFPLSCRIAFFSAMVDNQYWVYILMNRGETVLYIGVTNDLRRRISEHRRGEVDGFTNRYNCTKLVHAEPFPRSQDAIKREKQLKNWNRDWKLELIREHNPDPEDLYDTL